MAQEALIMPHLTNESLISVGKICDNDCKVTFTKHDVNIIKDKTPILKGFRNSSDGLWDINIPCSPPTSPTITHPTNKINYIIRKDKSKLELAQYVHACAFSPAISIFQKLLIKAILFHGLALKQ